MRHLRSGLHAVTLSGLTGALLEPTCMKERCTGQPINGILESVPPQRENAATATMHISSTSWSASPDGLIAADRAVFADERRASL